MYVHTTIHYRHSGQISFFLCKKTCIAEFFFLVCLNLQEENMLLEKSNRQKVLEIEKLTHTVGELEESILTTRDVANAVHFYQNQATRLNVS